MPQNTVIFSRGTIEDKNVFKRQNTEKSKPKSKKVLETEIAKLRCETHLLKSILRMVIKSYNPDFDHLEIESTIKKFRSSIPKLTFKNLPKTSQPTDNALSVNEHQSSVLKHEFDLDPKEFEQELKKLSGQPVSSKSIKSDIAKKATRKRRAPPTLNIAPKMPKIQIINTSDRSSSPSTSESSGYMSNCHDLMVPDFPVVYPFEPVNVLPSVDSFSTPIIIYDRPMDGPDFLDNATDPFLCQDFNLDDVFA